MLPEPGKEFNAFEFIKAQSQVTVAAALNTPQLSRLNKENPGDVAVAITQLLKFVNALFNLPAEKKLNDVQMAVLAMDIKQRYWLLKFDELVYVFREGVAGKWGKSYSRLDTEVIHGWIQTYMNTERDAVLEQAANNEAAAFKKQEAGTVEAVPMPEHIRADLAKLRHKLEMEAQTPDKTIAITPVLTQESELADFTALLPELTPEDLQTALKQAELKQNRELVSLIENELTNRKAA